MTPNKPTTLREEFAKAFNLEIIVDEPRQNKYYSMKGNEIADWWLEKLTSHNKELISKIEEEIVEIRKIWEQYDEYEKIINMAKIETFEKVINLINQEK